MRESKTLEFKSEVTNTFLKTVSAYANYGDGKIMFGVADNGSTIGIESPKKVCLDIENRINDSIDPVPDYELSIDDKTSVITLEVFEGLHKPYLYKAKAYKRNNTATVPVERDEIAELILEGKNLTFEELPAQTQDLTFTYLEKKMSDVLNTGAVTTDILKTLELFNDKIGINKAGELLADKNSLCGTNIIRFGESISVILDREEYEHVSILKQYDAAVDMYRKYYQYELITGSERQTVMLIPESAFREAMANAIVHRKWNINANISVSMFSNQIEIISPGGLPKGISREDYLKGGISILRNRIIGSVFFRLHLIERFGTGIRRINEAYRDAAQKLLFEITESAIRITLPVLQQETGLNKDEDRIFKMLQRKSMSSSAVAKEAGFSKTKAVKILNKLVETGHIRVSGAGRGTTYSAC